MVLANALYKASLEMDATCTSPTLLPVHPVPTTKVNQIHPTKATYFHKSPYTAHAS